ncbi:hypothetical protein GCM10011351_05130 [Paraliobacillus quinghaiensis]|uniref:GK1464-like domain-containing protein n=1 Tax=Paraliobacillus quinghaiensis TaxID=470815 RepID=A0A917TG64_9BACI|nr:DUF5634 family protein [Paraliobacillus quinghaiensis]GGM22209.1 hypothetical protein GCM10011351_05130 [Paraliobacillus quinghaiensis]
MKICIREEIINQLNESIPQMLQKYQFDRITTFETTGQVDSFYLGYQISIHSKTYRVYLPYLQYSEETLIALTPIWTIETIGNDMTTYRAYETLEKCLNKLTAFQRREQIVS